MKKPHNHILGVYFHNYLYRLKLILPFSGCPIHRKENYNPFFIVGSGRSGNTLLRRILHSHSRLFIPPEVQILSKVVDLFIRYRTMKWSNLVPLIYSKFQFYRNFYTFDIESLNPLVDKVLRCDKSKRSLAYIINSFYQYYAEVHHLSNNRWGDKTPINTFCMLKLYMVFPDARFIHIIRDGCDVVDSYVKAGIYSDYKSAALRWKRSIKVAQKFGRKFAESYTEVRYEDLVRKPERVVKELCVFLGIEFEPQMITSEDTAYTLGDVAQMKHLENVKKPITTKNIGKGRRNLSEDAKNILEKIIGQELRNLGYKSYISNNM
ncbi:sulfotransferase [Planctomycetota bacterium]